MEGPAHACRRRLTSVVRPSDLHLGRSHHDVVKRAGRTQRGVTHAREIRRPCHARAAAILASLGSGHGLAKGRPRCKSRPSTSWAPCPATHSVTRRLRRASSPDLAAVEPGPRDRNAWAAGGAKGGRRERSAAVGQGHRGQLSNGVVPASSGTHSRLGSTRRVLVAGWRRMRRAAAPRDPRDPRKTTAASPGSRAPSRAGIECVGNGADRRACGGSRSAHPLAYVLGATRAKARAAARRPRAHPQRPP